MTATKATAKTESDFYVIRAVQKASDKFSEAIQQYNDKYLKRSLEAGKKFGSDLSKDPKKAVTQAFDDGREILEDFICDRKDWVTEMSQKARDAFDEMVADGKKLLPGIPGTKTLEEKVTDSVNTISRFIHLADKDDLEKLTDAVNSLDKKVENLTQTNTN